MFTRIEPQTKEHEIVGQVRSLIYSGELLPGYKLPPEREFSAMLGVGRHTLRVALNRLAAAGLVEIRKSEGTFVKSITSISVGEPLKEMLEQKVRNIDSFLEVRKILESWAAAQAAEKATGEQLRKMQEALKQMEAARTNGDLVAKADMEFHMAIAGAAANPILVHLMSSFVALMHETRNLRLLVTDPTVTQAIWRQHEAIFLAIRSREASLASLKVSEHISYIQKTIRHLLSLEALPEFERG
jgi:GntR family transcriptional repressor for pyruvate dehydrogenase complex